MRWKFWSKSRSGQTAQNEPSKTLPKPREIPDIIGRHLVVEMKEDPDWVWELKAVICPKEDASGAFRLRLFDPGLARTVGVRIHDYTTLDEHPHLILYEGWYSNSTQEVHLTGMEYEVAGYPGLT
jgi:hypothetical protein